MDMRSLLTAVVLLGLLTGFHHPQSTFAGDTDSAVSMFRGNAGRTGHLPGPGPVGDPRELWRFTTSGPGNVKSVSASGETVYEGSVVGLHALDASTGTERWRFSSGGWVFSAPAIDDASIFVGSWDGYLHALDAKSGEERWRFYTSDRISSSPAVADGRVFGGSKNGRFFALEAESGGEEWRFAASGAIDSSPAVVDGVVFLGSDKKNV